MEFSLQPHMSKPTFTQKLLSKPEQQLMRNVTHVIVMEYSTKPYRRFCREGRLEHVKRDIYLLL